MNILPFKKNLTDLVRGLRNNKNNEQAYISQCIQEIKNELRADDKKDKMLAIQKLSYVRPLTEIFFAFVCLVLALVVLLSACSVASDHATFILVAHARLRYELGGLQCGRGDEPGQVHREANRVFSRISIIF